MLTLFSWLFLLLLFFVFLYSLSQFFLLINFLQGQYKNPPDQKWRLSDLSEMPQVTIQLPVYNEKPVIERLLKNISKIRYPREHLEIQVLDDSTDESVLLTTELVASLKQSGFDIIHLHRSNRVGYKAGALKAGLEKARGEFIAIFDADFLPPPDWIEKTLPYFKNAQIGLVQTRWGHLNRNYSLLTRLQAFLLDFHFILEQQGRNTGKHFINFNGTAGIWRKRCILDAGNWEGDTLTEDLDLSYRAQLKGWRFKYLEKVIAPAELPITMAAVRSQQFRWNKGAAENFRKNFPAILKSSSLPASTRFFSFFHLLNSSLFPVMLGLGLLSIPLLLSQQVSPQHYVIIHILFSLSSLCFFLGYWFSYSRNRERSFSSFAEFLVLFFVFFSLAMGLSAHNSKAVLEGHLGKKSEFVRTPKFNLSRGQRWRFKQGESPDKTSRYLWEMLLFIYFLTGIPGAFLLEDYRMLLFHVMLCLGFGSVLVMGLFQPISQGSVTKKYQS